MTIKTTTTTKKKIYIYIYQSNTFKREIESRLLLGCIACAHCKTV